MNNTDLRLTKNISNNARQVVRSLNYHFWKKLPKIFFSFCALFLVLELVWSVQMLTKPVDQTIPSLPEETAINYNASSFIQESLDTLTNIKSSLFPAVSDVVAQTDQAPQSYPFNVTLSSNSCDGTKPVVALTWTGYSGADLHDDYV